MGSPATRSTHVGEALRKSDIRFVHVRHEEVGGFAAGADASQTYLYLYAKLTTAARAVSAIADGETIAPVMAIG
jgi:thiamine pyrophosphate-dependent acetolactate synthase large subunit-like protein